MKTGPHKEGESIEITFRQTGPIGLQFMSPVQDEPMSAVFGVMECSCGQDGHKVDAVAILPVSESEVSEEEYLEVKAMVVLPIPILAEMIRGHEKNKGVGTEGMRTMEQLAARVAKKTKTLH